MTQAWVGVVLCLMLAAIVLADDAVNKEREGGVGGTFYSIGVLRADGTESTLSEYRGKLLLVVNVASKCGFTPQYEGLEKLYKEFKGRGLVILGFPSNDFLRQEPGTNDEIQEFCQVNYGVTFPVFSKISVKGKGQHPLYAYLTDKKTNPEHGGRITWNFNKFLIGPDGTVLTRFGSRTEPGSDDIINAIKANLPVIQQD